jgi:hypothetical protein
MFWNEIRDHIRERLPAVVDFILFGMALTMIAVVLLGLSWLYVEYGGALFGVAIALVCILGLWRERRAPIYFDEGGPLVLGGDKPALPPPGKKALSAPAVPQVARSSQRPALPGPKK